MCCVNTYTNDNVKEEYSRKGYIIMALQTVPRWTKGIYPNLHEHRPGGCHD